MKLWTYWYGFTWIGRLIRWAFGFYQPFVLLRMTEIASDGRAYIPRMMIMTWTGKGSWFWRKEKIYTAEFIAINNATIDNIYTNARVIHEFLVEDRYSKRMGLMTGPAFVPPGNKFELAPLVSVHVNPGCKITMGISL